MNKTDLRVTKIAKKGSLATDRFQLAVKLINLSAN